MYKCVITDSIEISVFQFQFSIFNSVPLFPTARFSGHRDIIVIKYLTPRDLSNHEVRIH